MKDTHRHKMAVIVIAYNDEKHIENAIDSVIVQTLPDIQIICVNDGSTDRTPGIMRRKQKEDSRITVLDIEKNSGQLIARKAGVEAADSEYILFLDSDDELKDTACEDLYGKMSEYQCDMICFSAEILEEKDGRTPPGSGALAEYIRMKTPRTDCADGIQLLEECFVYRTFPWCVWNKCYSAELEKKVYSEINAGDLYISEDLLATFLSLFYSKRFRCDDTAYYRYRAGSGITTNGKKILDRNTALKYMGQYRVLSYLSGWAERVIPESGARAGVLEAVYGIITDSVFHMLFFQTIPEWTRELMEEGLKYREPQDLILDCVRYVSNPANGADMSEAVLRLAGSGLLTNRRETVRTVGMYYRRMYNGGVERVISLLSPVLEEAGYRVVIITEENVSDLDYPVPESTLRTVLGKTGDNARERAERWRKIIEEYEIDLVLYHGWVDPNVMTDQIVIKAEGVPFVLYVHAVSSEPLRVKEIPWHSPDKAYALTDMIISLSEADRAWWSALGFRARKTVNPCTFSLSGQRVSEGNSSGIIWIGRINDDVKQFREAVYIVKKVHNKKKEAVLHVIGTTEPEEELKNIRNEFRREISEGAVVFHGYQTDVRPFYLDAKVCLSTSESEGFPMAYIESMTFGVPVVAYRIETNDLHRNAAGVITVPQKDREKAAEAVLSLLNDENRWKEKSLEARKAVSDLYGKPLPEIWKELIGEALQPAGNEEGRRARSGLREALLNYLHMAERRYAGMLENVERNEKEAERLRKENEALMAEKAKLLNEKYETEHQLYNVLNTKSWKIGRIITHIPRAIRRRMNGRKPV